MKKHILNTCACLLFLFVLGSGCEKKKTETDPIEEECNFETTETNPVKLIIGRWELSKVWMSDKEGYRPIDKDDPGAIEYREFGPDSLSTIQYIKKGDLYTENHKYWVDSLLYFDRKDGYPFTPWHYEFPDNCTLKIGNAFLAFSPIGLIYKRIEQ